MALRLEFATMRVSFDSSGVRTMIYASILTRVLLCIGFAAACTALPGAAHAQSADEEKLEQAAVALQAFAADEQHGIPIQLLREARGIAVIPNLLRGGFILGGRRGRGVLAVRTDSGEWSNPTFITLTGGSIGWQIGVDSTDLVLVFANERSVANISRGRFTLGGEAAATAGPLGRRTAAAVTARSEIYAYVRSRGLFAGAAFEGARLDVDQDATREFYSADPRAEALGPQNVATPASVRAFLLTLSNAAELPSRNAPGTPSSEEAVTFPLD
jgi:lipid-binding SYLF domain-containing protein